MSRIIEDFRQVSCEAHGTVSVVTWAECVPSVGVELWLLLTYQWKGLTHKHIGCEDWPWLQWRSCCSGDDPTEQDSLYQCSGACPVCPMGVIHWGSWVVLRYGQKLATGYIGSGASWVELGAGQGQPLPASWGHLVWATEWSAVILLKATLL